MGGWLESSGQKAAFTPIEYSRIKSLTDTDPHSGTEFYLNNNFYSFQVKGVCLVGSLKHKENDKSNYGKKRQTTV